MSKKDISIEKTYNETSRFALAIHIRDLDKAFELYNALSADAPDNDTVHQTTTNTISWDILPLINILKKYGAVVGCQWDVMPSARKLLTHGINDLKEFKSVINEYDGHRGLFEETISTFWVTTDNQAHLFQLHIDIDGLRSFDRDWLEVGQFIPLSRFKDRTIEESMEILKHDPEHCIYLSEHKNSFTGQKPIDGRQDNVTLSKDQDGFRQFFDPNV